MIGIICLNQLTNEIVSKLISLLQIINYLTSDILLSDD